MRVDSSVLNQYFLSVMPFNEAFDGSIVVKSIIKLRIKFTQSFNGELYGRGDVVPSSVSLVDNFGYQGNLVQPFGWTKNTSHSTKP